jgi:PEP-CTERM motif-containing protein
MNRNRNLLASVAQAVLVALTTLTIGKNICHAGPEITLYDVDFNGPPHSIGATPAFGFGAYPRNTPTSGGGFFPTGSAIVVSGAGQLVNRPVRLTAIDGTPNDPGHLGGVDLHFDLDDPQLSSVKRFHASVDVLPIQLRTASGLGIFFDASSIHSVQFWPDGNIHLIDATGLNSIVGPYSPESVYHVQMTFDPAAVTWAAAINGTPVYQGPAADNDMDRFRIAMTTGDTLSSAVAFVDNIRVTGDVPEPTTTALVGLALSGASLFATRRRKRPRPAGAATPSLAV